MFKTKKACGMCIFFIMFLHCVCGIPTPRPTQSPQHINATISLTFRRDVISEAQVIFEKLHIKDLLIMKKAAIMDDNNMTKKEYNEYFSYQTAMSGIHRSYDENISFAVFYYYEQVLKMWMNSKLTPNMQRFILKFIGRPETDEIRSQTCIVLANRYRFPVVKAYYKKLKEIYPFPRKKINQKRSYAMNSLFMYVFNFLNCKSKKIGKLNHYDIRLPERKGKIHLYKNKKVQNFVVPEIRLFFEYIDPQFFEYIDPQYFTIRYFEKYIQNSWDEKLARGDKRIQQKLNVDELRPYFDINFSLYFKQDFRYEFKKLYIYEFFQEKFIEELKYIMVSTFTLIEDFTEFQLIDGILYMMGIQYFEEIFDF